MPQDHIYCRSLNPVCLFYTSKGLHYFGQLHENGLLKVAFDQLTEGQLEFVELPQHFDSIVIDDDEKRRDYAVLSGKTEMEQNLKKHFPDDVKAVEEFFKIMKVERLISLNQTGRCLHWQWVDRMNLQCVSYCARLPV